MYSTTVRMPRVRPAFTSVKSNYCRLWVGGMWIMLIAVASVSNSCPSACSECPPPGYNHACCNVANGTCDISHSQCSSGKVSCSAAHPLPPSTCPSWARCVEGYCYAVMDRHPYDSNGVAGDCQTSWISLPVGWEIAPNCNSEVAFQLSSQKHDDSHYAWATDYLVYANRDYSGTCVAGSPLPICTLHGLIRRCCHAGMFSAPITQETCASTRLTRRGQIRPRPSHRTCSTMAPTTGWTTPRPVQQEAAMRGRRVHAPYLGRRS